MWHPEEFLEFLKGRRSIRSFEKEEINEEHLKMILEAARWTPSASNRQPWHFIVIKDKEKLQKISETAIYGKFFKRAPLAIAIVGKPSESPNWYKVDTSLVSMQMMLMAWALGIGSCWIGSMDRERAKELLGIDKQDYLLTVLPFGYIKGNIPKPTLRKALSQITERI
ncbi:MAG: nitroreductase family protein [Candidatus Lokiarchaeota archaeon]|jgi:nitroreductase